MAVHDLRRPTAAAQDFASAVFETTDALLVLLDREGRIVRFNHACERISGFRRDEVQGRHFWDTLVRPENVSTVRSGFVEVVENPDVRNDGEHLWVSKLGEEIPIRWTNSKIFDANGAVAYVVCTGIDLRERHAALRALRESEERFRSAFDSAPLGMALVLRDGRPVKVNRALCDMLGYSEEELLEATFAEITHPEDLDATLEKIHELYAGEIDTYELEKRYLHREGRAIWALVTVSLVRHAEGASAHTLIHVQDISDRKRAEEALRQSEQRFRRVFDLAPVGIVVTSMPDRKRLMVNQALCEMLGYSEQELLAATHESMTHPDDVQASVSLAERLRAGEIDSFQTEKRYLHKDGHEVWVLVLGALIRDASGQPEYVVAHIKDITERRRAEEALRESEESFRTIFDSAAAGMAITSTPDGRWLKVNPALCKMLGYEEEELLAMSFATLTHPDDVEESTSVVRRLNAGEIDSFQTEKRYLHKDGHDVWALVVGSLVRDAGGHPSYAIGQIQDITERRQAAAALQETTAIISALFEASPAPIAAVDRGGRVTRWNKAAEHILGWTENEVVGRFWPLVDDSSREEFLGYLDRVLSGETLNTEIRRRRKDGSPIDLSASAAPYRSSTGEIVGTVCVLNDFTERNRLQAELVQAQRLESVGRLAGGIAHDFNNILTAVSGYAELLLADLEDPDPRRTHAEEIGKAAARAGALVRQLLTFSSRQFLQPRVMSLNTVLAELEPMLGRLIGEDVELVVLRGPELSDLKADSAQVEQMIVNLVVNARDAMPEGGLLEIASQSIELGASAAQRLGVSAGPYVVLRVRDTGVGIDEETKAHIFEPFFTTKEPGKGTGLGLATAYGLVTQSGGSIQVESEPGFGTTFSVYLPAVEEEQEKISVSEERSSVPLGSETILLVEDEESVRNFVSRILLDTGYRVLVAADAHEAIRLAAAFEQPIDLLLTDVVLPEVGGRQLAERLRAERPEMRVLYASGYPDDAALQNHVIERSAAFIAKPFGGDTLRHAVRQALENGRPRIHAAQYA